MRLCFISQASFTMEKGSYYSNPAFVKLLEMIAPLYDEVELCVPVFDRPTNKNYSKLCIPNLKLCPLPPYWRRFEIHAFRHPLMLMRCLWPHIKRSDTILMSLPNYMCVLAWLVCLLQRKRFVLRIAGNFAEVIRMSFYNKRLFILGNIAAWLHHLLVKTMVKTSTLTIVNGQELANIYGRNNQHVVPVISSTYHETDIATTIAGSGRDECRLLYVGRLMLNKGLSELFRAARNLLEEGLDFRIWLAADGYRRKEIRAEAEELGIIDRVDFLGWIAIEKLKHIYRTCDIFVLPSYTEGMPKVVTEAMSNGLATVVTDVGGLRDNIVQEGKTGFIVPVKDVPALRDALRKLIVNKTLRQGMAEAGLERSHKFTMESERACVKAALRKFGFLHDSSERVN